MPFVGRTLIVGAGRSGLALARLLRARGGDPALADERVRREELPEDLCELPWFGGSPRRDWLDGVETLALSPGVPASAPLPAWALAAGTPTLGEVEIAFRLSDRPVLAITGTNGKSTTTTLASLMLEAQGMRAPAGGNLGRAYSALVLEEPDADLHVLEISSFQCEGMESFRPDCGVLLNLTPDHLDRYGNLEEYFAAKLRLFERLGERGDLVLPAGDEEIARRLVASPAARLHFSLSGEVERGCYLAGGVLRLRGDGEDAEILPARDLRLVGDHNLSNALAAAAAVLPFGVKAAAMAATLRDFPGLPHRMEELGRVDGLRCFNDSKATNVDATIASLSSLSGPILLIAGGRDKGGDFSALARALPQVRVAIGIGEAGAAVAAAFGERGEERGDLRSAFALAREVGREGEWIVLSPACASYDQYRDFEERGDHLRRLLQEEGP